MAQSGYTPIKLYYSTTASAVPSAANLADGELALNIADMKLYAKNSSGAVTLLASNSGSSGTVSTVSVVSANGLAGTVANATTTPAITLSTSVTGVLKGNGTAISAAVSGTDYAPATSGTAILKGSGSGGFSNAVAGTDYAPPTSGTSILYGNGSGGFSNVTIGSNLTFTGGTLAVSGAGAPAVTNYVLRSTTITLTAADGNTITDATLANEIKVVLPDATTLTSAKNFIIKNSDTTYGMAVYNNTGVYLFCVAPGQSMTCWAKDTTTAAGVWSTSSPPEDYLSARTAPANGTAIYSTFGYQTPAAAIDSTSAVYAFVARSGYFLSVATLSGGSITFGTPVWVGYHSNGNAISVTCIGTNKFIVAYPDSSNQYLMARAFTVSGSTITLGSPYTVYTSSTTNLGGIAICSPTTDAAVIATTLTSAGSCYAFYVTASGTALTIGSASADLATGSGFSGGLFQMVALSSTRTVLVYADAGSNGLVRSLLISGTTVGLDAGTTASFGIQNGQILAVTSNRFLIIANDTSSNVSLQIGTVSSGSVSLGSASTAYSGADTAWASGAMFSGSSGIVYISKGNAPSRFVFGVAFTVSGTSIASYGSLTTIQSGNTSTNGFNNTFAIALQGYNVAAPSATNAIGFAEYFSSIWGFATSVSGTTITNAGVGSISSPVVTGPSTVYYNEWIDSFSTTQFVYLANVVTSTTVPYNLTAYLYGVDGNTITLQSSAVVLSGATSNTNIFAIRCLSSTVALAFFNDSNGYPTVAVVTRSGNTLSVGSTVTVEATATAQFHAITMVSATSAVISYRISTATDTVRYRVVTISGTVPTVYSSLTITGESGRTVNAQHMCTIASDCVIAGMQFTNSSSAPVIISYVVKISGTTLTTDTSTAVTVSSNTASTFQIYSVAENTVMFAYQVSRSSPSLGVPNRYGFAVNVLVYSAPSSQLFPQSEQVCNTVTGVYGNNTLLPSIVPLSSTNGVIFSANLTFSMYGYELFNGTITTRQKSSDTYQPFSRFGYAQVYAVGATPLADPAIYGRNASGAIVFTNEGAVDGAPNPTIARYALRKLNTKGAVV